MKPFCSDSLKTIEIGPFFFCFKRRFFVSILTLQAINKQIHEKEDKKKKV